MCNDLPGSCLQPKEFYVRSCLFDEMVKAKYSSLRSHEEIVVRLTAHVDRMYSVSLDHTPDRAILCHSCAAAFLVLIDVKTRCAHFNAMFYENKPLAVSCCIKCLKIAVFRYRCYLRHVYRINCCNCFFDVYLIEINQNLQILKPSYQNQLNIMRIWEKRSTGKYLHKQCVVIKFYAIQQLEHELLFGKY